MRAVSVMLVLAEHAQHFVSSRQVFPSMEFAGGIDKERSGNADFSSGHGHESADEMVAFKTFAGQPLQLGLGSFGAGSQPGKFTTAT